MPEPPTVEAFCEALLRARDTDTAEQVAAFAAVSDPVRAADSVEFLLARARTQLSSASAVSLRTAVIAGILAESTEQSGDVCAAIWRVRGQALRGVGDHTAAVAAFTRAATEAQRSGDFRLAAQVQVGSIDSLAMLGRYDEAFALADQLEQELQRAGAEVDAAKVLFNVGGIYFRRDEHRRAQDCYERAAALFAWAGSDPLIGARVGTNLANVYTQLGRVEDAITLYTDAGRVFADAGLVQDAAVVDTNLGFLQFVSGRHAAALSALTRASHAFTEAGRALDGARADLDAGEVYRVLNLYPEALECYNRAARVFTDCANDYDRARADMGRGGVYMALGRFDDAEATLTDADTIFRTQRNALQRAHIRLIRAYRQWEAGNEAALPLARSAARTFARQGMAGWAAEANFLCAEVALKSDPPGSVRKMRSVLRVARTTARGWLECRAEHALGLFYARRGSFARAVRGLRAAVAAIEAARTQIAPEDLHVAFLRDKLRVYEDLVETLLTRGRPSDIDEALGVVERAKSRLLLERLQTALAAPEKRDESADSVSGEVRTRLAELRARLSREYHRLHDRGDTGEGSGGDARRLVSEAGAADSADEGDGLVALEQAYRAALRDTEIADNRTHPFSPLADTVSVATIRAALPQEESLLEFYVVREKVCAFLIDQNGIRFYPEVAPLADVLHAARRFRYHLQRLELMQQSGQAQQQAEPLHRGMQDVLSRLYDLLLRPIAARLTTEKLTIVPHGVLHGLPFHAFFEGSGYAVDRWEIVYTPSATIWFLGQQRKKSRAQEPFVPLSDGKALVMGVPGPGIEGVIAEIEALSERLPHACVLRGADATLAAFYEKAPDCRVLHLATHALFRNDNPLFSGLRLTDNWLLARDLYETALDHCELANLSACRTGISHVESGDELFGLVRGFLAAGAASVAASLWPADDAATTALMIHFYTFLAQGLSKAAALRQAQFVVRGEFAHPYHWAAFVLVGQR